MQNRSYAVLALVGLLVALMVGIATLNRAYPTRPAPDIHAGWHSPGK